MLLKKKKRYTPKVYFKVSATEFRTFKPSDPVSGDAVIVSAQLSLMCVSRALVKDAAHICDILLHSKLC